MIIQTMSTSFSSQIHGINGMIDQYYVESLPHLLQELDDVYHDVSAVVLESLTEGSNKITEKVGRYRLHIRGHSDYCCSGGNVNNKRK